MRYRTRSCLTFSDTIFPLLFIYFFSYSRFGFVLASFVLHDPGNRDEAFDEDVIVFHSDFPSFQSIFIADLRPVCVSQAQENFSSRSHHVGDDSFAFPKCNGVLKTGFHCACKVRVSPYVLFELYASFCCCRVTSSYRHFISVFP